jgi:CheY-like chemotaxis protein
MVPTPPGAHRGGVSPRILIVDDSREFRRTAAELLALRGFEVIDQAGDGEEAMAAVAADCPDAVLLDVNMPGQDGYAVSLRLAAVCPRAVIVLTSSEEDDVPAQLLDDCGAAAFVHKTELATRDLRRLFRPSPAR